MRHVLMSTLASLTLTGAVHGQGADVLLDCSACHTVGSSSQRGAALPSLYPNLNGQSARYLAYQLHAYRTGLRQHPQMQASATALGEGAAAMARLYADAPAPQLSYQGAPGAFPKAERLVTQGDWSRGLPSCASCHALDAEKRAQLSPRLHGHPAAYLTRQLRAYADGTRRSGHLGRMQAFSALLTEAEISELAEYYAAFKAEGPQAQTETEATPDE